jgi:hypothetical protein
MGSGLKGLSASTTKAWTKPFYFKQLSRKINVCQPNLEPLPDECQKKS